MAKHPVPNVPFVEAKIKGGQKHKPTAIVLQASFTPSTQGAALHVAHYWHRSTSTDACHYVLDAGMTYRCIPDELTTQTGSAFQNGTIWVDLCITPSQDEGIWFDGLGASVFARTVNLVAELCLAHKIRPTELTREEQGRWYSSRRKRAHGGIIIDVPGAWPSDVFLSLVRNRMQCGEKRSL